MINPEQQRRQSHPRLTFIAIGLMLLIGAIIIFLDRNQVKLLPGRAEWNYLAVALGCVLVSYLAQSTGMVMMLGVFGVKADKSYLLRTGLVSSVLSNLVALPAALALQILVLGRRGATQSQIVGSSLLLSYFKNLVFYTLIPLSLVYVIFTFPLAFGGVAIMILIIVVLVIAIMVATVVVLNSRVRSIVLKLLGHIWHFLTHKNIETRLTNFGNAVTQGIVELKEKPKVGMILAAAVILDVAAMIAGLAFCFKALGIPVHLGVLITGFNFGITLTVISFIPGDIGVQEASIAGIMAIFGVPFGQGVLAAILFRVLYYFVPFVLSLGLYWSLLRETRQKADQSG
jgi:uncharacterized protein (TIRG00374 family)